MKPVQFEQANIEFVMPESMGIPNADFPNMPACVNDDNDWYATVISCWELSDDDIKKIIESKKIWVEKVMMDYDGERKLKMRPMKLSAENPFE